MLYNTRTYMEYIYEEIDGEYTGSKVSCTGVIPMVLKKNIFSSCCVKFKIIKFFSWYPLTF